MSTRTPARGRGPALLVAVTAALGVAGPLAVLALGLAGGARGALPVLVCAAAAVIWPVAGGLAVRRFRERVAAERRHAEQAAARLADRDRRDLVTAKVAAERTRMARELHDLVANDLSTIAVQSAAALSRADPPACRQALDTIRDTSVRGLAELRQMVGLLRDGADRPDEPLTTSPRLDELEPLLERARRAGLAVTLEVTGEARPLPAAADLAAYRILRESLANARAHAGPVDVRVRLDYRPGGLAVTVDNPLPPAAARTGAVAGAGLVAMRERAVLLGGTFSAGAADGRWRVRADLPC
ncbi:MAG: sensor histidine kinase [Mycobacteriales bacterium]